MLLLLGACDRVADADGDAAGPTRLILKTDWYAEPEHGGFYLALLRGYYLEEGIDLEIQANNNISNIYQQVATGQVDFGLGTSDTLLTLIARDIPLVGVMPYFQRDPQGVMVHPGSEVRTLQDLDGRKVMLSPTLNYVEFLQRALGIRFQLVPLTGELANFLSDEALAQQAFLTSEPYFVMQAGVQPRLLPFWDTGFEPYRIAYTRRQLASEHPELVAGFIRASLRGWADYTRGAQREAGRVAAFTEIARRNPQQSADFMAWTYAEMARYRLVHGREGEALGQIDRARLRREIGQLSELQLLERNVQVEEAMTFDLYPQQLVVDSDDPQP
ncbi:ABC transporter substrate-binding protein [Mangrovimicrobium sediminis]|nr:ABC transporter substrate-binding protein [Haliea sp. SAOS-164]